MSKAKFEAAKELIAEKQYDQARAILKTIDHPTARAWEEKLNKLSPPAIRKRQSWVSGLIALILVGIAGIAVVVAFNFAQRSAKGEVINLTCDNSWWAQTAEPIVAEFLDTAETAGHTPRASLAPVILQITTIYRQFDQLSSPSCFSKISVNVDFAMKSAVRGFNDFLGEEDDIAPIDFSLANLDFWEAAQELQEQGVLNSEYRMTITDTIWGGDKTTAASATNSAIDLATFEATTPTPGG